MVTLYRRIYIFLITITKKKVHMSEIKRLVKPNPVRFRKDTFEFLKNKIMDLNPGVQVDWEDLEIISTGGKSKSGTDITLRIKESAKINYINPHKEVKFTYTTDTSYAEIFRDVLKINEVNHYDDADEFVSWFTGTKYVDGRLKFFDPIIENASPILIERVYKKPDGSLTTNTHDYVDGVYTALEQDVNTKIVDITISRGATTSYTLGMSNGDLGYLLPILASEGDSSRSTLRFVFTKESTATKDLNVNGGEFTVNTLGLQYSELTTPYVPPREGSFNEDGAPI